MEESPSKKRRYRRVPLNLPVHVFSIDPETDRRTGKPVFRNSHEVCANLSRGGACIRTSDPLSPGRRVLLELELPGGECLETLGRVAWSRLGVAPGGNLEAGCGVEFLGASAQQRARLDALLERADV